MAKRPKRIQPPDHLTDKKIGRPDAEQSNALYALNKLCFQLSALKVKAIAGEYSQKNSCVVAICRAATAQEIQTESRLYDPAASAAIAEAAIQKTLNEQFNVFLKTAKLSSNFVVYIVLNVVTKQLNVYTQSNPHSSQNVYTFNCADGVQSAPYEELLSS